jgi:putative transposase
LAHRQHVALHFIQPGKPIRNSHIESFTGRLRDACLHPHWFLSLRDAPFPIERWRRSGNTDRSHAACATLTPDEYARAFPSPAQRSAENWRTGEGTHGHT